MEGVNGVRDVKLGGALVLYQERMGGASDHGEADILAVSWMLALVLLLVAALRRAP